MATGYKKRGLLLISIIIFIWYLGSVGKWWNPYLLPSPTRVINTTYKLIISGVLFIHIYDSFIRILLGFLITICLAIPLGIIFGINKKIYSYFNPLLEFMRHTPPLALVPMLILWFGIGEKSKIIIIILASFFPVLLNTIKGVESCDEKLIEVGEVFNLTRKQIFFKIIIPSAFLDIFVGMKLAIGYSWRAIIGAEMVAASSGLGYLILDGQQLSRTDVVVVGILCIGILGTLTDYLFSLAFEKFSLQKGEFANEGL